MVRRRRDPQRDGLSLPDRRGRDQGRANHRQYSGPRGLEEVVRGINGRNDVFPWWNKIDTTQLTRASKLVSAATSFPVQYNKAIVGRNAFPHEGGITQEGGVRA